MEVLELEGKFSEAEVQVPEISRERERGENAIVPFLPSNSVSH